MFDGPERAAAPGISGRPARLLGLLSAQQQTDVLAVSRYVPTDGPPGAAVYYS
jgi:hypothetical protein